MSPFFKLLASVSSLAMVTGSFITAKIAEARETDSSKSGIPVVRVETDDNPYSNEQFSEIVETLAKQKKEKPHQLVEEHKIAQAAPAGGPEFVLPPSQRRNLGSNPNTPGNSGDDAS
jgi:hypothetical protein